MKLKSFAALMMAGVMALGLCACNSEAPDTSGSDSTPVSISTTESWDFSTGFYPAMSPATSNGTYGFTYYARNCYDTLVVREGGEFKAGLAETWDISDDGLTYTFHLKEGVKFSDGADLNAEAVKTSLEAAFSNLGDYIASFGKIGTLTESIEVVDEHTVAIHLTTPYYGVLNDLAMCNPMGIVSPNAFNEDLTTKEELMTQTMGTGPYMYAGDGDGTSYTFVRNPNYWGEQPDVDEFTVKVMILIGLVVALFGIALIICMLPVRKTGGSFFRKYAFVIFAEVVILTGIILFVIGIVKAWPMLI